MSPMLRRAFIASALMGASSLAARALTPTLKLATVQGPLNLEASIPPKFADWEVDARFSTGIVNPQQQAELDRLYSSTLSRTYVSRGGQRVMLSIAYGEDQRDGMEAHHPEVCYPAQGFRVVSSRVGSLQARGGSIPVRRLETVLANQRHEPVTYWMMLGEQPHLGGMAKRAAEVRLGFKGFIADGLLFRVSSIGSDTAAQFALQDAFLRQLLDAIPARSLTRISGLPASAAG